MKKKKLMKKVKRNSFFFFVAFVLAALLWNGAAYSVGIIKGNKLTVELKKGQIVRMPVPVANVFIADSAIADVDVKSPNYIWIFGRAVGETSLQALDKNDKEVLNITVNVTHNLASIKSSVKESFPNSDVKLRSINGGLVLEGTADTPEQAEAIKNIAGSSAGEGSKLVNLLKVKGSDQVMLKVKVAEVARSEIKNLGINLQALLTRGGFVFGLLTGRDFLDPDTGSFLSNGKDNTVGITRTAGNSNVSSVIDALESQGAVHILAEPTLIAKSGETADFLAGGEFPVPVPGSNGTVTISYRQFGVMLNFSPTVLADNRISMSVTPEVSSLSASGSVSFNGFVIPSVLTRRTSTTVELGSGEAFAIAGLLKNEGSNDMSKFPWLGDVPVLGTLFRSNSFRNDETELVIIVTPYIVKPVSAEKLATPVDGLEPVSDFERLLLGATYKKKSPGEGKNTGIAEFSKDFPRLNGPAGFMRDN